MWLLRRILRSLIASVIRQDVKPIFALKFNLALAGMLSTWLTASAAEPVFWSWAKTPPMGWNSWDCYGAGVRESNVLANADYMAQYLKPHGWDIITIDIQWYEPLAHTTDTGGARRWRWISMGGFSRRRIVSR